MGKIQSDFKLVLPIELLGGKLVNFLPLPSICVSVLTVEEAAFVRLNKHSVGIGTVGEEVGVEVFISNLRGEQATGCRDIVMLRRNLITPLMQVRRRGLRSKRIQTEIIEFLREDSN